jgi:hypothetical protein
VWDIPREFEERANMSSMERMNAKLFVGGLICAVVGGAFVYTAFAMHTGDGMFGGVVRRAPIAAVGVILFVPGLTLILISAIRRK